MLVRILMLPLLAAAAGLLYLLALMIGDVVNGAPEGEYLTGQLLCLVGALLIGVPGLMGFLVRKSVRIDRRPRMISEIQDFRLYRKTDHTALSDVVMVRISCEQQEGEARFGRQSVLNFYDVGLVRARKRGAIVVATFRDHAEALGMAKELAELLDLRCKDLSGSEPAESY
jgi:hypothetical protein